MISMFVAIIGALILGFFGSFIVAERNTHSLLDATFNAVLSWIPGLIVLAITAIFQVWALTLFLPPLVSIGYAYYLCKN